jgi:demethylmenaquinone methyltransferase / 2-methoxy-6-polyprenyl-1,4-benzoquinol methylase
MAQADTGTTHFGYENIALADKQKRVDTVFHAVAGRYDLMNDLMSAGVHRAWKEAMVTTLNPPRTRQPFRVLDVAGGTGDIAFRVLKRGGAGVHVTLLDINGAMLDVGRSRARKHGLENRIDVVQGNAESLPFPDRHFDAVTIAFGIRNVPRIEQALAEFRRVLKTGGRFLCLEFSQVDVPVLDKLYDSWSFQAIPPLGGVVTGDAQPYQYLVESIRKFPKAPVFEDMIRQAGFDCAGYTPFTGGIACLHKGWRI